ncbi:MAG TPA: polymer-forming cytoskeletal protein [Terriglobales bacterium]|nr:polymer-forming cytoskeletal protein [Terriglobales bacterium]
MWKPEPLDGSAAASNKPQTFRPEDGPKASVNTPNAVIGKNLIIKGEISGTEPLLIEGQVEGTVNVHGCYLGIGPSGRIKANVNAAEVVVRGTINGNLNVSERLEIRSGGSVNGDIVTRRLSIEEGAYFHGTIDMQKSSDHKGDKKPHVPEAEPAKELPRAPELQPV